MKQQKYNNLKIMIGSPTGFCFGVKRAIKLVKHALKKNSSKVYTLGPIIHNQEVVNELKKQGVKTISEISELKKVNRKTKKSSIVIIRSHGATPQLISDIKKIGFKIIDVTCPYVKRVQNYARKLKEQQYLTVIIGDKNHPEVKGILGYAHPLGMIYQYNNSHKALLNTNKSKIGIIGQTTLPPEYFQRAVDSILSNNVKQSKEIRIFNTLCKEAVTRQNVCKKIAHNVDVMVVIGGKNSANTRHLADIAKTFCAKVYQVEDKDKIRSDWFKIEHKPNQSESIKVGVVAGTSTPQTLVFEVVNKINKIQQISRARRQ